MHKFRSFAVSSDGDGLLGDFADPLPIAAWTAALPEKIRIGFVYWSEGGKNNNQWLAMGRELIQKSPLFKQTLQRCDNILSQLPDAPEWSVVEELLKSQATSRLAETRFSQPLCTSLQLAICTLLTQWGIEATAVVGHSREIGAAYAAGILSFENAMIAAYYRGLYMSNGPDDSIKGAMMAVGLTEEQARVEIEPYTGLIAVAAINSPPISQAFHSHHMFPLAPGYLQALEKHTKFTTHSAQHRMFSSVTGKPAQPSFTGPQYWVDNMVGTVRFSDALSGILLDNGRQMCLHADLPFPLCPSTPTDSFELDIPYLSSSARGTLDFESLLTAIGQIFALGYPVDLGAVNNDHFLDESGDVHEVNNARRLRDMPKYCWDHTARYWAGARVIHEHRLRKHPHSILGVPLAGSMPSCPRWRNFLRLNEVPWLVDHKIGGNVVFPAAGCINMVYSKVW
ncbi:Lovastatin diketide synthase mokB [Talaromyces pinophilus]|nr:Lovastatin diketide synthase mokB [Talaromyces pinophilus]